MKQGIISLFILSCIFVFLNCSDQTTESVPAFDSPEATDDGWETATPAEMGLNETPLDAMLEYIDAATAHSIHSITIVKDNKIVLDEYFSAMHIDQTRLVKHQTIFSTIVICRIIWHRLVKA